MKRVSAAQGKVLRMVKAGAKAGQFWVGYGRTCRSLIEAGYIKQNPNTLPDAEGHVPAAYFDSPLYLLKPLCASLHPSTWQEVSP